MFIEEEASIEYLMHCLCSRDDHGNGISTWNGNPLGMGQTLSHLREWKCEETWMGITLIPVGNVLIGDCSVLC